MDLIEYTFLHSYIKLHVKGCVGDEAIVNLQETDIKRK